MEILKSILLVDLARYAENNDLPYFSSFPEMRDFLQPFVERNGSFQAYTDPFETLGRGAYLLYKSQEYSSCLALIAMTLEEDINRWVRVGSYIKGYSHKQIDELLKTISFKAKIDYILPLLGIPIPEQYKTAAYEFQKIRNEIAHNKARPEVWGIAENDERGSAICNADRAKRLIQSYPMEKIYLYAEEVHLVFHTIKSVKISNDFLNKYFEMQNA